jgi:AcrR family transcriptional regulator
MPTRTAPRKRLSAEARREVIALAATEVFAEHGYRGASVEEIARRSGVSVPVLYDHFASKRTLYEHLLEQHYSVLRTIWFARSNTGDTLQSWLSSAVDDWFGYVHTHRFAGRMLFRDTTGDPAIAAMHRQIQASSRGALLPLLDLASSSAGPGFDDALDAELAWETMRAVLQGLALWWYEHPDVPHERIVTTAMNFLWIGLERHLGGEEWPPT